MRFVSRTVNSSGGLLDIAPDLPEQNCNQWPATINTYYRDSDDDGYGDPYKAIEACSAPMGYVSNGEDCNDTNKTIYPGATEICDGKDNDCDGTVPIDESDPDKDGIMICEGDNCPYHYNPNQEDEDKDGIGNACDQCDNRPIIGNVNPSINILWPPNHKMVPVTIDVSDLSIHNPNTQVSISSVTISEARDQESDESNIENNFEPDFEITGDLILNLRSERMGDSHRRTYTITVTASDCSGSYTFTTEVIVPHDKGK